MTCLFFTTVNVVVALRDYPPAPATFEAKDYTQWTHKIKDARRATISVPFKDAEGNDDSVEITRLDVVGDSYSRGYGHGYLLAKGKILWTIAHQIVSLHQLIIDSTSIYLMAARFI